MIFSADVNSGGTALLPTIAWGPALGTGRVSSGMTYAPSPQPIYYLNGKVSRVSFADIAEHAQVEGNIGFGGVDDHYFLAAVVTPGQPTRLNYEPVPVAVPGSDAGLHFVSWSVRPATAGGKLRFFAGPKDFNVLTETDQDLSRAIDFGMFGWLVVSLLRALKWVNGYIGNYGWSIIALTVIINLVDVPAAPQERGVDAEDAGDSAGGQSDPGSLRQAEDERPGAAEDERRAHESVS